MISVFRRVPALVIAGLALLVSPAVASATAPLTNAVLGVGFTRGSYISQTPGSYTSYAGGVDETVNWGVRPAPFLETTVKGAGNMLANLTYTFDVAGPAGIDKIPLFLTGRLSLLVRNAPSAYGIAIAETQVGIFDHTGREVGWDLARVQGQAGPDANPAITRGFSLPFTIQPNTTGKIVLTTRTLIRQGNAYMPEALAYSMIDPVLSIDPVFAAANPGVSLKIDATIGNATGAVPEPASWAMMVGGFGLVGGALRSRRKAALAFS